MSPEHAWLRDRLVRVCHSLGFEAIPEHPPTDADVYVTRARYALEVQLRPTDFGTRIRARAAAGAHTLWLMPPSISGHAVEDALFHGPSVRVTVRDQRDRPTGGGSSPGTTRWTSTGTRA